MDGDVKILSSGEDADDEDDKPSIGGDVYDIALDVDDEDIFEDEMKEDSDEDSEDEDDEEKESESDEDMSSEEDDYDSSEEYDIIRRLYQWKQELRMKKVLL